MPSDKITNSHCNENTIKFYVSCSGAVYFFGQTKKTGEAWMYPKPIQDLHGWNVRSVGCANTSIVIAADESVIAWGPSPAFGELVSFSASSIFFFCTFPLGFNESAHKN